MATATEAQAVKSLNTSAGRRRFVFKKFSQRVEDIDIDVYRSLHSLNSEPSSGSTFFRDCLVEWRELNTAEDFISFYEEMLPLVQTLPQIILQKDLIFLKLLSRLQFKARLSLEPILRMIAALSRDLVQDFIPFLRKIADSLASLLKSGADRDPEIIEQIFTSWSYIMMHLQKYLVRDVVFVLKVTVKLRYYQKDYIQEFMAESVSFVLRNAPEKQLEKGIQEIMLEVVKKPLEMRTSGASALLFCIMRGTSSNLHSRAKKVIRVLLDKSILTIGDRLSKGFGIEVEVVIATFNRLCEELEPAELEVVWDSMIVQMRATLESRLKVDWNSMNVEISAALESEYSSHLSCLLSVLVSTLQRNYIRKLSDYEPLLKLVAKLLETYLVKAEEQASEIIGKVMQLMLCILDGLNSTCNMVVISRVSQEWAPVFKLKNSSLLAFIKQLLSRNQGLVHAFGINIIKALNDSVEASEEEVVYLLLIFFERLDELCSSLLRGVSSERLLNVLNFFEQTIKNWVQAVNDKIHGKPSCVPFQEDKMVVLYGVVRSFPYVIDVQSNANLLMDLVDALDQLVLTDSENIAGFSRNTWTSLIGCCLGSYNKVHSVHQVCYDEASVGKFLNLAKKYKSSSQVLCTVADFLDSIDKSTTRVHTDSSEFHPELRSEKAADALTIFAENLCQADKQIRLSTLRILCHYESLASENIVRDRPAKKLKMDDTQSLCVGEHGSNVLHHLRSIEETSLSVTSSRQVILHISKIQMDLIAANILEPYIPVLLYGIVGIFHNRFSYLWNPATECLAELIRRYSGIVWERYIRYVDGCQSFYTSQDQLVKSIPESFCESLDLITHFKSFVSTQSDGTPYGTIMPLLIQSLQKVIDISESRTRHIIPLFLRFLGYNCDNLVSVQSHESQFPMGKEWKIVLGEWLNLLKMMRSPKSFYLGQFLKDVLVYRLLDSNDAELQMKVLDCILNWKDEFLQPYGQHLKNLINSKHLREELTTWSLSRESNLIDEQHRPQVVPIVLRLLAPKVRNLKTLSSRKHASIHQRKAVLGFIAELDINELPLFYALLLNPLQTISHRVNVIDEWVQISPECTRDEFNSSTLLKQFTVDNIRALPLKKIFGFLHVVEDVLGVFDIMHVKPFLNLLMGCVVRVLTSCSSSLFCTKSGPSLVENESVLDESEKVSGAEIKSMTSRNIEELKSLRSLCLKILSFVLTKYDDHDFHSDFWDPFFTSVKPLIDGFRQEASSSEKPSALFSCFIAMSRSRKLVSLLNRERNLLSDIFSILTVSTASEAIISCVLKFIENLLKLDEQESDNNAVKIILLPSIDTLVCSLHCLFTRTKVSKRKSVRCPGEQELNVFRLLSKYIKDPSTAGTFVDVLLPLLSKKPQNTDEQVEILHVIQHIVQMSGSGTSTKIVNSISPLLISAGPHVRLSICNLLKTLSQNDPSALTVADLLHELNAPSTSEMGGLDYDTIIGAYDKINIDFFYDVQEEHALVILSHFVHDMSSEELILRQSAYRLMLLFVEFCGQILDQEVKSEKEGCWSRASIQHIINNFLLKHMGDAMNKEATVQKVWIDLLKEMVLRLSKVQILKSFQALCSKDAEQDFFNNIVHMQKHRRARALTRFCSVVRSGNLSEVITTKVFVPLLFNMLFNVQDGKGEHLRSASIEALASISGCMDWKAYYELLNRCFKEMTYKPDKQKLLLRLISSLLDHFHFSESGSSLEVKDSVAGALMLSGKCNIPELSEIQAWLYKKLLPKVQKILTADSDHVNVNINMVALKLLKLLPAEIMESQLSNIIHRVSNFLRSRLESIRDEARSALSACLKELGLEYLQFIVKVLRATLKRGFEMHVLGYTLNFLLSRCLLGSVCGKIDYCLEELLSIAENDILGDVSEEKEVEKIASKMKETRKNKSFETLKLIAQNVTFKTHALKLLSPVTVHFKKHLKPKEKVKLESMLKHIAAGIECNTSLDQTDFFIFTYSLIEDGVSAENCKGEVSSVVEGSKHFGEPENKATDSRLLVYMDSKCSPLITVFALRILHDHMKNAKLHKKAEKLLSMLDPFVRLLGDCLSSKYEDVIAAALRCLSQLVHLPLPSLESQADKIKSSLLVIAQGSGDANSPIMQSCIRLLTVLLRSTTVTLSSDHLHMLIQFPLFVEIERNPSVLALSLLKTIIKRKLVVPEIYELVTQVAELIVTSQVEPIRKKSSQVLLQFLLDYKFSEKRLLQHLSILLKYLSYEHSTGREAGLEMLHAIINKLPESFVDQHSQIFLLFLVKSLANDHDQKVRSMAGAAIKLLVERVSTHCGDSIIQYCLTWYEGGNSNLWSIAAQVLGLLVEVKKKGFSFQKHLDSVFPVMRNILQSSNDAVKNKQLIVSDESTIPFWKESYYSLVMLEKILHQYPELCLRKNLEDVWELMCEFLLHPHMWLRNISNRLVALYFSTVTEACKDNHEKLFRTFFLIRPSRLFQIAVSLCCQLRASLTDGVANAIIEQNLVFSICGLHALLLQDEFTNSKYWSELEHHEQGLFLRTFHLLDSRKGRSMFASLTSSNNGQDDQDDSVRRGVLLVSYLLKRLGKIGLQMEAVQMKIVFNTFRSVSPKIFDLDEHLWKVVEDDSQNYAYHILLPLYKVCEGFAGKVIPDDVKQLAQDVCESIQSTIGTQNFVQVYSQIRKQLKAKRDKRKQEEKLMAVVNPMRNAKRKLRVAAKHRANKKRKVMTLKMGRWNK
ncbi:DRIM domain-containing protein [Heracleum sosnowskyi]|uniref:DRIM domain-containing protein n=1 Tax=Heracleum sosnowskyi TaxID=360622 RepID=A0AAD8MK74_9APIA|nr:DRIM domain-containing protein [Heracleum sosnowskyi]